MNIDELDRLDEKNRMLELTKSFDKTNFNHSNNDDNNDYNDDEEKSSYCYSYPNSIKSNPISSSSLYHHIIDDDDDSTYYQIQYQQQQLSGQQPQQLHNINNGDVAVVTSEHHNSDQTHNHRYQYQGYNQQQLTGQQRKQYDNDDDVDHDNNDNNHTPSVSNKQSHSITHLHSAAPIFDNNHSTHDENHIIITQLTHDIHQLKVDNTSLTFQLNHTCLQLQAMQSQV